MSTQTIKQGALVTPKEPLNIDRIKAHPGQTFWVTTSSLSNATQVGIARSGRPAGYAKVLSRQDFDKFFQIVSAL